jgi:filamentous hemagglutinin
MSSNIVTISDYAINLNSGANTLVITGTVSATGNITGGNLISINGLYANSVSTSGNITGGNLAGENLVINNISSDDSTFVSIEDGLQIYGTLLVDGDSINTGNITGGNLLSNGIVSAVGNILTTGNVRGGNILSQGLISAAGTLDVAGDATITGNLTVNGNITYINSNTVTTNEKSITLSNNQSTSANVDGSGIDIGNPTVAYWRYNNSTQSWQSNVGLTPAANLTLNIGGTANYWATAYVNAVSSAATVDSVGNITGGNLLSNGIVSAVGNILTGGLISATSTITSGANITGGNIRTSGQVSAVGNISGDYYIGNGYFLSGVAAASANALALIGNTLSSNVLFSSITGLGNLSNLNVVGNTTSGNLITTGNVTGSYLFGNGVNITGIFIAGSTGGAIISGTSNVVIANSSNVTVSVAGVSNVATWTATGQYITGALSVTGALSATGNITGNHIIGNGALLTNINATVSNINLGTSNVTVVSPGGNITVGVNGTSNVVYWSSTGEYITGLLDVSLTANVGNLLTNGLVSAGGNVRGGNILTGGLLSATGNITGGNLATSGTLSIGGNVTGNLLPSANLTYDLGSTTQRWKDLWLSNSTIYMGNATISSNATSIIMTNPAGGTTVLAGASGDSQITGAIVSATGNITGGNILTAGQVSATGNITGGNILGIIVGNVNTVTVTASGNVTGGNLLTGGLISSTGNIISVANITGGNVLTAGQVSATGNVTGAGFFTAGTTGVLSVNSITHTGANGVGNIGSSTGYFNTVFAQATSAQYADVAEMYSADHHYAPGTVVVFGGAQEVTISNESHDARIAGVVSTHPAHLMNSALDADHTAAVALLGRVPCQVTGAVEAGDRMVSSGIPGVAEKLDITQYQPGTIIGKALENYNGSGVGTIEIVVGRL